MYSPLLQYVSVVNIKLNRFAINLLLVFIYFFFLLIFLTEYMWGSDRLPPAKHYSTPPISSMETDCTYIYIYCVVDCTRTLCGRRRQPQNTAHSKHDLELNFHHIYTHTHIYDGVVAPRLSLSAHIIHFYLFSIHLWHTYMYKNKVKL